MEGLAIGTVFVEAATIPAGSDFSTFHISQNGGYNMAKINNTAGIVTLVCETEDEGEPCNDVITLGITTINLVVAEDSTCIMLVDVYGNIFDACLYSDNTFVRTNRIIDGTEDYKEFDLSSRDSS